MSIKSQQATVFFVECDRCGAHSERFSFFEDEARTEAEREGFYTNEDDRDSCERCNAAACAHAREAES